MSIIDESIDAFLKRKRKVKKICTEERNQCNEVMDVEEGKTKLIFTEYMSNYVVICSFGA